MKPPEIPLTVNEARLNTALATAKAKLAALKQEASSLTINADATALSAKIAGLEAQAEKLQKTLLGAKLAQLSGFDIGSGLSDKDLAAMQTKLAAINAEVLRLRENASNVSLGGANANKLYSQIVLEQTKVEELSKAVGGLGASADNAAGKRGGGGLAALGFAAGGFFRLLGPLNKQIPLFGGVLAAIPFVRTIGGLHLIADVAAEIVTVVGPAAIAVGAFGIAASGTVRDIVKQEQGIYTVSQALGKSIPGLKQGVQSFTDSVKPQVFILFGEALGVVNNKTGAFQKLAVDTGRVLDNLGARAANALGGPGLSGLVSKGAQDLQLLGNIIGNVFGIFGNLLKNLPGYAQPLFLALQGVTGALEKITSSGIVQGLFGIGLAFHGAVIYGGLAATGIIAVGNALAGLAVKLGLAEGGFLLFDSTLAEAGISTIITGFGELGTALITLGGSEAVAAGGADILAGALGILGAVNPFVWVAAAVGGLVALGVWLANTSHGARDLYNSIEKQVSSATSFTQANMDLAGGLQQVSNQLQNTPKYLTVLHTGLHDTGTTITKELNPAYAALLKVQGDLSNQQVTANSRFADLNKITGSYSNTLNDLSAIGKKAGDVATANKDDYARLRQQIVDLTNATVAYAGYVAGPAAAAQNALTNQWVQETLPAIQKITQAESNLITVITGGRTALDTFEQGFGTLNSNLAMVGGATGRASHSLAGLRASASIVGAALDGTTQASYALNQAFYTQVGNAQNLITSLMQQGIAQGDLTKVIATGAEQLVGYAGSSKEARSVIVDLINNALGPGTTTLQNLNQWVGTNATSLGGMNRIVAQSTIKAGALAGVLSTVLQNMQAVALFQAHGGQQAWNIFTADIQNGQTKSRQFIKAAQDVVAQLLIQSNNSLPAARRAFENYAVNGLRLSQKQADALWNSLTKSLIPALQNSGRNASNAKSLFDSFAGPGGGSGLGLSTKQADALWKKLTGELGPYLSNGLARSVLGSKANFEAWAGPGGRSGLGLTRVQAGNLYNELRTLQGFIDTMHGKTIDTTVVVKGAGGEYITTSTGAHGQVNVFPVKAAAAGWRVDQGSGPTADDVPALLSRGETVVSAAHSKMLAPYFKAIGVPGYAAGGLVGSGIQASADTLQSFAGGYFADTNASVLASVLKTMNKQVSATLAAQAAAAAATSYNAVPARSGSAAAAQAFARAHLGQFGWGAGQFPPLLALWNQESGWNANAVNPSSGAYGIPQALGKGHPYNLGDYANQVLWGLSYIKGRYGSPSAAEGHELAYNWYDAGGWIPPGVSISQNNTGQYERVPGPRSDELSAGERAILAELQAIRYATQAAPAQFSRSLTGSVARGMRY